MPHDHPPPANHSRWLAFLLIFGLFLTLRGYHSRDGDQAYRLPLLLRQQDPRLFDADPFVRAFDAFNPHRGSLALLDLASRPMGLSAGLLGLFAITFGLTCAGIDRLARVVWPELSDRVGIVAIALLLIAKAGNIGTNHLFEAMLLDRLMALALGWLALARAVGEPGRGVWATSGLLGLAAVVHPSFGLQLALLLGAGWVAWSLWPSRTGVRPAVALRGLVSLALALAPGLALNVSQGARLLDGLSREQFWLLSVELQGPQHMLPHLWRAPQWVAWGCYGVLAALALGAAKRTPTSEPAGTPQARVRLSLLLVITLAGLAVAWLAVEVGRDLRITLFQPFRMATVFRGLALVALSGRVLTLWQAANFRDRSRAALVTVGLAGDRALIVATLFDVAHEVMRGLRVPSAVRGLLAGGLLAGGLVFLARHDTESGHVPLLGALGLVAVVALLRARSRHLGLTLPSVVVLRASVAAEKAYSAGTEARTTVLLESECQGNAQPEHSPGPAPIRLIWTRRRLICAVAATWLVPLTAMVVTIIGPPSKPWAHALVERCRFGATPGDDVERLAVWCRDHTPVSARFIGPPGPKTFRLWSERSLAFNRSGSPYHAAGLADWSSRFRDHVGFAGPLDAFVRSYLSDRHALERRYEEMGDAERARLAIRQGASYVVAASPSSARDDGPLELLHTEGRYAVYRVRHAPGGGPLRMTPGATATSGRRGGSGSRTF